MRIVGGRFRGRALAPVGKGDEAARLRPTTDRVRETLFNILEHGGSTEPAGARVLDLFAGTGALGLEALSRGADFALFVETGAAARAVLRRNIELLDAGAQARLLRRDATALGAVKGAPFDLVFADPPYRKGLGTRALVSAARGGWLAPGALVVLEEGEEVPMPDALDLIEIRRLGDTYLHLARAALDRL